MRVHPPLPPLEELLLDELLLDELLLEELLLDVVSPLELEELEEVVSPLELEELEEVVSPLELEELEEVVSPLELEELELLLVEPPLLLPLGLSTVTVVTAMLPDGQAAPAAFEMRSELERMSMVGWHEYGR